MNENINTTNEIMATETNEIMATTQMRPVGTGTQQKFLNRNTVAAGLIGLAAGVVGSWITSKLIEKRRKEYIQKAKEYFEDDEYDEDDYREVEEDYTEV